MNSQPRNQSVDVRSTDEEIEFFHSILRHDLLNGIAVVEGQLCLLEDHVDEQGQNHLDVIDEWMSDIADLTEDVRDIVNAMESGEELTFQTVDVSELLEATTGKVRETYDEVTIETDVEEGLEVRANRLLDRVVENIVTNAVKHNDSDGPRLWVRATQDGDEVCVRVADDGPGIHPDEREDVFDPEVTSDSFETYGFGLYFVRTMVDQYGGSVHFDESDHGGAEAVLELPAATEPV